ncbi:heavy-metal-associated domain-containing protein [Pseudarthrobacter sp. P1]|uniref:heavy-metal-associated domain-containing protein n=1 Tax=Pseudarthrobacter sp. P1 TaxID=3418418 RepID=UPI003CF58EBE
MCGTDTPELLTLTPAAESPCACCSTGASAAALTDISGTTYGLQGLTCGHCVQTVETAVSTVAGVESASIDLATGGTSTLTVSGTADPAAVRAAVALAGYAVTGN